MTPLNTSIKHFASLNCAPGSVWTEATKRKAPHKPILLLVGETNGIGFDFLTFHEVHQ
jgi:hypothetical protein